MDAGQAADRQSILHVVSRYISAIDRGAIRELVQVFTEDATMQVQDGPVMHGRAAILSGLEGTGVRPAVREVRIFQRHLLTTAMINLTGTDRARGVHYIQVFTELGLDHTGVYVDRYAKVGGEWLIADRLAALEWGLPNSRFVAAFGTPQPLRRQQLDIWSEQ